MTTQQAQQHNDSFPFTAAPCDYCRSFPMRSFPTLAEASKYAKAFRVPYVVALPSGAVTEVG